MNIQMKSLISALLFMGSITTASASAVITKIEASGAGLGSFTYSIDEDHHLLDLHKIFTSVNPIDLTFTVGHGTGDGSPYNVIEEIINSTGVNWTDFHFSITEPTDRGQGIVFTSFDSSTLSGFTLDSAPSSGPRNLNYTGSLTNGDDAHALFKLSLDDPGAGNTTTFVLHQVPTIPEPETYAMLLIGLGLLGATARRRK